jgi:hypothetical protein
MCRRATCFTAGGSDGRDHLGDDADAAMVAQQVVHVRHRTGVRVLDGDDGGVDLGALERREDLRERAPGLELLGGEQRRGRGLRERAGQPLVRDAQR